MSHSSRIVAIVASLALAGCSTVGTINEQRLDAGMAPLEAQAPRSYPCQDAEFLCIVAVGAIAFFVIAYSQDSEDLPAGFAE